MSTPFTCSSLGVAAASTRTTAPTKEQGRAARAVPRSDPELQESRRPTEAGQERVPPHYEETFADKSIRFDAHSAQYYKNNAAQQAPPLSSQPGKPDLPPPTVDYLDLDTQVESSRGLQPTVDIFDDMDIKADAAIDADLQQPLHVEGDHLYAEDTKEEDNAQDEGERAPVEADDDDLGHDVPASPSGAQPALTAQQRQRLHQLLQECNDLDNSLTDEAKWPAYRKAREVRRKKHRHMEWSPDNERWA